MISSTPRRLLPSIALGLLAVVTLLLLVFGTALFETFQICWTNDDYSHGLLLPFISAYLIANVPKTRWSNTSSTVPFSPFGLFLVLIGLTLSILGELSELLFFRWLGFFPTLIGGMFLVFGRSFTLPLIGPLVLNFMAKPLPDSLVPKLFFPLQVLAAKAGAKTLDLLQVPVYLRGNVIEIPGMQLMVEEACSGLRSLLALLTVAAIVLLSMEIGYLAKLSILFLAVAIAVVLNIVRVALTGVLAHFYDPAAATGFFHTFSGMVVFIIGLVLLYSIGSWIETRSQQTKDLRPAS